MTVATAPATPRDFWETIGGPAWVANQDALDRELRPVDDALLAAAALAPGQAVLDVGCGAAAFTLAVAERVRPGGRVVGVDFSATMLGLGRSRVAAAGDVELVEADLESWRPGETFDVAVSRIGLPPSGPAVASVAAALKPGGRLGFACFRTIAENLWMLVPTMAVAQVLPMTPPPPDAGGPFALADPNVVRDLLATNGFTDVTIEPLDFRQGMTGDAAGCLEVVLSVGPAARPLAEASPEDRAAAREAVGTALAAYDEGDGPRVPSALWVVTATKG